MITEYEIETVPRLPYQFEVTIPVEIEIPRTAFELCQWQYKAAQKRGMDPYFPDYLCDLVVPDVTYYVDGVEVDEEAGELVDSETTTEVIDQ